jgi:hypothetical protein
MRIHWASYIELKDKKILSKKKKFMLGKFWAHVFLKLRAHCQNFAKIRQLTLCSKQPATKKVYIVCEIISNKQGCIKHFNAKVFRVTVDLFSGLKCRDFADCFGFWNRDFRNFGNITIEKSITTNLENSAIIWWGNEVLNHCKTLHQIQCLSKM